MDKNSVSTASKHEGKGVKTPLQKPKRFKALMAYWDEFTNRTKTIRVDLEASTKRAAEKLVLDLIRSYDPWVLDAMGVNGQEDVNPVELIGVYPSFRHDLPCRVWTTEELESGDLEKAVREPDPFSLEASAYHEAGHALVIVEHGWPITAIEVFAERRLIEGNGGKVTHSLGGFCHYIRPHGSADEEEILVSMAGPVAEALYQVMEFSISALIGLGSDGVLGGATDFREANSLAEVMHFAPGDELTFHHRRMTEAYLTYMAQRVRIQYLDPHWAAVERLARALIQKKKIPGPEVVDLLGSSPAAEAVA